FRSGGQPLGDAGPDDGDGQVIVVGKDVSGHVGEADGFAAGHGLGDGDQTAHRGDAVVEGGAELGGAAKDDVGEALDLPPEGEAVLPQQAATRAVLEALDVGTLEPRQRGLAEYAAVRAVDPEALFKIAAPRADERQLSQDPVGKVDLDRPAMHVAV